MENARQKFWLHVRVSAKMPLTSFIRSTHMSSREGMTTQKHFFHHFANTLTT